MIHSSRLFASAALLAATALPLCAAAQDGGEAESCRAGGPFAPMDYPSVEPLEDGRVIFRLCAPEADGVRIVSNDLDPAIPAGFDGGERGLAMARGSDGMWSATTTRPIAPDTYRFNFEVDGQRVPDPMATTFSRERTGVNSTFEMPGESGAFQSYHPGVAHGAVTRIEYWSAGLEAKREAFVYTPPGYLAGDAHYPVLYLVHGSGDSADSWTSVGHAHYIADNLLAADAIEPMIIVMPFGHTPPQEQLDMLTNDDFGNDLIDALIPHVDATFRTLPDTRHRAMAGLSMGGAHTLNFGVPRPDVFGEVGVFSMGLGFRSPAELEQYRSRHAHGLRARAQAAEPVYYAMGTEDFLYSSAAPTLGLLEDHGIAYHYNESDGGHTWINWRRYLHDFLPRLFR
jgi:enterochelin esterase family protein